MSSKQLNFFITPEDYSRINEFIIQQKAKILLNQDLSNEVDIFFRDELPDNNQIFQVYLSLNKFEDNIIILTTKKGLKYFDIQESCILEFSFGGFYPSNPNILQRARFYYTKSFYDNNGVATGKRNDFVLWCDDFIKEFKKEFLIKYSKEKEFLYSKSAIDWIEKNEAKETEGGLGWEK